MDWRRLAPLVSDAETSFRERTRGYVFRGCERKIKTEEGENTWGPVEANCHMGNSRKDRLSVRAGAGSRSAFVPEPSVPYINNFPALLPYPALSFFSVFLYSEVLLRGNHKKEKAQSSNGVLHSQKLRRLLRGLRRRRHCLLRRVLRSRWSCSRSRFRGLWRLPLALRRRSRLIVRLLPRIFLPLKPQSGSRRFFSQRRLDLLFHEAVRDLVVLKSHMSFGSPSGRMSGGERRPECWGMLTDGAIRVNVCNALRSFQAGKACQWGQMPWVFFLVPIIPCHFLVVSQDVSDPRFNQKTTKNSNAFGCSGSARHVVFYFII
ncbi:hypothetical protein H6P81_000097 [Aristolochia fimbriata]|uniref:Uncharacterized protein n=1 Tax=Aristolochia fimbriata TaxID=158543 RepID=A0AAV7F4J8_ARIFI|nr:hypothetical protein H6P81_000097 [Aristolochia fimbriata]